MEPAERTAGASEAAERRYLTIAFSDLVDYTRLSELVDEEELHDVQRRYQRAVLEIVERYGGFVSSFSGDGVLFYFGYPVAHENDAERAVRAALELVDAVQHLDLAHPAPAGFRLQVRVGLHTGQVLLASELASGGVLGNVAIGQAANLASRLQAIASPNSIVVSGDTLELVEGLFDVVPLGPQAIRGLSQPVAVHKVTRARPSTPRNPARFRRGAARVVGRSAVLDRMRAIWQAVYVSGQPHSLRLVGEAGLGKTRLTLEFLRRAGLPPDRVLQVNCHELFAGTPLYAVAAALWSQAGLEAEDAPDARQEKIATFLGRHGLSSEANSATASDLFETLGVVRPSADGARPADARQRRFDLFLGFLRERALLGPMLLWIEDAHWLDPSSAEILVDVAQRLTEVPLFIIVTTRPVKGAPLPDANETIELAPLSKDQCLELVHSIPGSELLGNEMQGRAVALADGNPFFVEQLTLALIDAQGRSGSEKGAAMSLPLTLAEMVSERLDRLPSGRRAVQVAACLGGSVSPPFLGQLLGEDEQATGDVLEQLAKADILRRQKGLGGASYEFSHALLQHVAYESMVKAERRSIHARIVTVLKSGASAEPMVPEVLAHHLTAAGQVREAVDAWLRAGVTAERRSANVEAIAHIERGLELLSQIADAKERDGLEIELQAALIGPLTAIAGPTSDKQLKCCRRGLQLCSQAPSSPRLIAFLFGQYGHAVSRGDIALAASSAGTFLTVAREVGYETGQVVGHRMLGLVRLGEGRLAGAIAELETSLKLYVAERDDEATYVLGHNPQVHSRSVLSLALLHAGRVEDSIRVGVEALRSVDESRHPHSSALAMGYVGGWVFGLCGVSAAQMCMAQRLLALAEQHRLRFQLFGQAFRGWALCTGGKRAEGVEILGRAVHELAAARYCLSLPGHMAFLADQLRKLGRYAEAAAFCDRGLQQVAEGGERLSEPELKRVRALVATDERGGFDDRLRDQLLSAMRCARELALPLQEYHCLQSLRASLGKEPLPPELAPRADELAHLANLEQQAARLIAALYPAAAG